MTPDKVEAALTALRHVAIAIEHGSTHRDDGVFIREALSVLTEALAERERDAARLSCYQRAVNKIDDLVEYREFAKADIYKILAALTAELQEPPHDR